MTNEDFAIDDHQTWIGYLQPQGLVVSATALSDSNVLLDRDTRELHQRYLDFWAAGEFEPGRFLREFLQWPDAAVIAASDVPEALKVPLRDYGETLTPDFAVRPLKPDPLKTDALNNSAWLLLVQALPHGANFDSRSSGDYSASASQRLERLLRDTRVPMGLLCNGVELRLMYAPRGENAGHMSFPLLRMQARDPAARRMLAALHMLLGRARLFTVPTELRLLALLERSRSYQAKVSSQLSNQVLAALYELLRGLQAADARTHGKLLARVLSDDPNAIYRGLLTVLMRLVFLLFAEDRGLMPGNELYFRGYSLHGLFERLRADHERYPDTMDQRFGAWAQLLALFRVLHSGCKVPELLMPARRGYLFDPARFAFLEGSKADDGSATELPWLPDGSVNRVLNSLLWLAGERLSYRTLDVEQIGSVYETMMGFELLQTRGTSIALKPNKAGGAPVVVDLDALLNAGKARAAWLKEHAEQSLPPATVKALEQARSVNDLLAALQKRVAQDATPQPVPAGALLLQPNDTRRKQGSHYTPRALTEPMVRTTLAPVLAALGANPSPTQVLALKVCDPAVGSGAFLVEANRQLAEALVRAWHAHRELPDIPDDEDELLLAKRLIAQRCLYGVDRNPMAVDLAKLSLWLATLAKDHPFTFLDHAVREGDALVGLDLSQVLEVNWNPIGTGLIFGDALRAKIYAALRFRLEIVSAGDDLTPEEKSEKLAIANRALENPREAADLALSCFFAHDNSKARLTDLVACRALALDVYDPKKAALITFSDHASIVESCARLPLKPFHWPIEFPEVFSDQNPGFDAIVGNPPFAGKNTLINGNCAHYLDWLQTLHPGAHGNADLVAHFFRRAFHLLRSGGSFGLIATNTIAQGDTRATGLAYLCQHGGSIFAATRRYAWPGAAAVVVSQVHVFKGVWRGSFSLDGRDVPTITAFLFHAGGHDNPKVLAANADQSFQGCIVLGMGFTFDDTDKKGIASPLAEMQRLIAKDARNAERIFPFLGGEEVNDSPTHAHHRYVINFGDMPLKRGAFGGWIQGTDQERKLWLREGVVPLDYPLPVAADWPDLLAILEAKVKPERDRLGGNPDALRRKKFWWQYGQNTPALSLAAERFNEMIGISAVTTQVSFARLKSRSVFSHSIILLAPSSATTHFVLQSRIHESWTLFFSSSLEDRIRYTPTDCFETFPFPENPAHEATLTAIGERYLVFRAELCSAIIRV